MLGLTSTCTESASENPLEVFTPSPALPPQWSGEITARGLDESAETRCGEILIESKTAGMTHQPLLPLSVQKRLLLSLFSSRRSCGGLH